MKHFLYSFLFFILVGNLIHAQQGVVSGNLKDSNGLPLPGVTILIKGTTTGTQSDFDGNYSIECEVGDILVFNYVGMKTREVMVTATMFDSNVSKPLVKQIPVKDIQTDAYKNAVQKSKDTSSLVPDLGASPFRYESNSKYYSFYGIKDIQLNDNVVNITLFDPDVYFEASMTQQTAMIFVPSGNLWKTQNIFAQGRPSNNENTWFGPDTNEIFSYGPRVNNLEFDGSVYPFDPNGGLVPAGNGNGNSANTYKNDLFATALKSLSRLDLSVSSQKILINGSYQYKNQEDVFGIGRLRSNSLHLSINTQQNYQKNTKWYGTLRYQNETNTNPDINGIYSNALFVNSITPPTFKNRFGNRFENNAIRSMAPAVYNNPYGLLETNNNETSYTFLSSSIRQNSHFSDGAQLASQLGIQQQKDRIKFALPPSTVGFEEGILNQRNFNERKVFFNNSYLLDIDLRNYQRLGILTRANYTFEELAYSQRQQEQFETFPFENPSEISFRKKLLQNHTLNVRQELEYKLNTDLNVKITAANQFFISSVQKDALWLPSIQVYTELDDLLGYPDWIRNFTLASGVSNTIAASPLFYSNYSHNSLLLTIDETQQYLATNDLFLSPELRPERSRSFEIETSFELANGLLDFGFSYFNSLNKETIFPILDQSEFSLQNVATIRNRGFEASLDIQVGNNWDHNGFRWDSRLVFSSYRTKVQNLKQGVDQVPIAGFKDVSARLIVGEPAGVIVGSAYLRNTNGQKVIGQDGFPLVAEDQKIIGDPIPDFNLGFTNTFELAKWSFSFVIDMQKGGDVWNATQNVLDYHGTSTLSAAQRGITDFIFEGVTEAGAVNTIPVDFANPANGLTGNRWVQYGFSGVAEDAIESGSYLNLKSVRLAYDFGNDQKNKFFRKFEVGFYAENLWTSTSFQGASPYSSLFGNQSGNALNFFNTPLFTEVGFTLKIKI
ncbi:carboxypeptidase-like regulatory domain-containing protein [Flavobacteriaceae bacterium M23B6Z8]